MQCKKCLGKFEPPKNINLSNCPFCQAVLEEKTNFAMNSYETRILKIIQDRGEIVYTKKEFTGLIRDYFPNDELGRLLVSIVMKKGAIYVYNLKDSPENELQTKYKQVIDRISKETFIAKEIITPAVDLLCFGLGLKLHLTISKPEPELVTIQVPNQSQTSTIVQPLQVPIVQSNLNGFIINNGILVKYLGSDTSINIPNQVKSIGRVAFKDNIDLVEVIIPNTVKFIGESAFEGCYNLTTIILPNSITEIGGGMFFGCSKLTQITIPNTITEIGYSAFKDCTSLTQITFPDSVTTISGRAFENCNNLIHVSIPNSVTEIGWNVFFNTSWLNSLREKFNVVGAGILIKYLGNDNQITIPNSVNLIHFSAFECCLNLNQVTIPNSVNAICNSSFKDCTNLKLVSIPDSVTFIGDNAFEGCNNLSEINIPNSVKEIGKNAFLGCDILPENVRNRVASSKPSPFDFW